MLKRILRALFGAEDVVTRGDGQRCGTCVWCDVIGDDPDDEPNGYCLEPGNRAANYPYAGSFTHAGYWCREWKKTDDPLPAPPEAHQEKA
jgi:hypothetical protein